MDRIQSHNSDTAIRAATPAHELMRVVGLTKHYNGQAALDQATFPVRTDEILGIIGPSEKVRQ